MALLSQFEIYEGYMKEFSQNVLYLMKDDLMEKTVNHKNKIDFSWDFSFSQRGSHLMT